MKIKNLFVLTIAILAILILTENSNAQSDTATPQLLSLDYNPKSIDTSNSPQTVTYTVRVTDNISGVTSVSAQFQSPSGQTRSGGSNAIRISGDAFDGVYQGTITFPQYSEAGTYKVSVISAYDAVSNWMLVYTNELESRGFPTILQVSGIQDTATPQLVEFNFSPKSIDTSNSSQTITYTARVTDNVSGVTSVSAQFQSPSGQTRSGGSNAIRISGDALDGIYQGTITFPQHSEAGTYKLSVVSSYDAVSNWMLVYTNELESRGFPTILQVSGAQDTATPQLVSFDYNPKSIDTSNSPQTVTYTVRVTDNISGVTSVSAQFQSPSGQTRSGGSNAIRISGDAFDGVYQGTITFPQYSEAGTYKVSVISAYDAVSNWMLVYTNELESRGFPTQLRVNLPPTAASVTIGGRVLNPKGRGVNKAIVILTDSRGEKHSVITNPFGYYRFTDVAVGITYILEARHKLFNFTPQPLTATSERDDLNFLGQ